MKIACENLSLHYGPHRALENTSCLVQFPHVLALIGPSGGGKSSLLRILAGLALPTSGTVSVDDRELPRTEKELRLYRRRVGVVFQSYNLFPHLTARQNILLPLEKVHRLPDAAARADRVLDRLRLLDHAGKRPAELSGGQNQRVAIARALAVEPDFLMMDEPTSALDPEMTAEVLDVISELKEESRPLILVTHAMGFARQIADEVAFVADGKIAASGKADAFFENPGIPEAQRFLGKVLKY